MSQESLAAAIGITRSAYSRYESKPTIPSSENILALASTLRVEVWQLFHPDPQWASDMILIGKTSGRLADPDPERTTALVEDFGWGNIPIEPRYSTERERLIEKHHGRRTA